jgi:hypothetical protein
MKNPIWIFVIDTELGIENGCPGWDRTGPPELAFIV